MSDDPLASLSTRASMLIRLKSTDAQPRELAWEAFRTRYARVITGFARNMGAKPQEIDDIIQDVMLGFFNAMPAFEYDPARGRFRGYLKTCTMHTIQRRASKEYRFKSVPIENVDPSDLEVDHLWNDIWEREQLKRAIDAVRDRYENNQTFQAFELVTFKHRSVDEAARDLGMNTSSVYKAKQRISEAIKQELQQLESDEG